MCQFTHPQVSSLFVRPAALIENLVELIIAKSESGVVLVEHLHRYSRKFLFRISKSIAQNGLLLDIGIKIIVLNEN